MNCGPALQLLLVTLYIVRYIFVMDISIIAPISSFLFNLAYGYLHYKAKLHFLFWGMSVPGVILSAVWFFKWSAL